MILNFYFISLCSYHKPSDVKFPLGSKIQNTTFPEMEFVFYICICLYFSSGFASEISERRNSSEEYVEHDITFFHPPNAADVQHASIGNISINFK